MPIGVPTLVRYSRDSVTRTVTPRMDGVVTFFANDAVTGSQ